jgi:hypothetical protein
MLYIMSFSCLMLVLYSELFLSLWGYIYALYNVFDDMAADVDK